MKPITQEQYTKCRSMWPLSFLSTSISRISYSHTNEEKEEIVKIIRHLEELNRTNKKISSLVYDPKVKSIVCLGNDERDVNPISHPIMNLIHNFSIMHISQSNPDRDRTSKELTLGEKNELPPYDEFLASKVSGKTNPYPISSDQYYCENFYVFSIKEPCIMCSMALVHSRIARLYFTQPTVNGGVISRIQIGNYNLNHSYLTFQLI